MLLTHLVPGQGGNFCKALVADQWSETRLTKRGTWISNQQQLEEITFLLSNVFIFLLCFQVTGTLAGERCD